MNIRTLVVVPTFDNPATIANVVASVLEATSEPILVVDDGSALSIETVLTQAGLMAHGAASAPRLAVVRHERNRGKGAALKTAFAWALERGYTHVLTLDGDGQHLAAEAKALLGAAEDNPWNLIVGVRVFPEANVPQVSRFGREFSNFWIHYETGIRVRDSQSGMRVYPLFFVQNQSFLTDRYDFEVEAMTRLLWAGVELTEVEIQVAYPPAEDRVSHFKKFGDNLRISLLNVYLVTCTLFTRPWSGISAAASFALAVMFSFQPWHKGAVFAGIAVATVVLRLNALIGTLVFALGLTLPPLFAGRFGVDLHGEARLATLAVTATLAILALGFALYRSMASKEKGPVWSGSSRGGAFGTLILRSVSRFLGLGATYVCLAFIAPYFYLFAPKAKRSSLEFLAAAMPDRRGLGRHLSVIAHFFTFGMVLLDRLFQGIHRGSYFELDVQGRKLLDQAEKTGKGVVLLAAHAGGWDITTRLLVASETEAPTVVAGIEADGPRREQSTDPVKRASFHNQAVPILAYKEILDKGGIVCMMGDRPISDRIALVPFLGKLAAFDLTPFRLALSVGAPVIYAFAFKTGFRTYRLTLTEAPQLAPFQSVDRDALCETALRHFVGELERHLRQHPYQWFNFYPFFSARPAMPVFGR